MILSQMKPPYNITEKIVALVASISEKIGEINATHLYKPATELRKKNRIKTIQSSLEIEGNTLTEEQITALLENKRVLAPQKDILEVQNAIKVYEQLNTFNPFQLKDLEKAHAILMKGLIDNGLSYEEIVRLVQSEDIPVSLNLTILLRTLIENKNNEEN